MIHPTAKEKRIFKEFKFNVKASAEFALSLVNLYHHDRYPGYKVKISNMDCIFYPLNQKEIDKAMRKFKTTVWWPK